MQKVISTDKAPSAIGPYSQAIEINNMVYTSGVIPVIPATGEIAEGGTSAILLRLQVLRWRILLRQQYLLKK